MKERTCFFTGHRIISGADMGYVKRALSGAVLDNVNRGVFEFIAGGAFGFDMLAAEAVLRLREDYDFIRLRLFLPYKGHEQRWKEEYKARQAQIALAADEICYISSDYSKDCMKLRNEAMVNASQCCIAWYKMNRRSGTGQTVAMAERAGCEIRNLALESRWE